MENQKAKLIAERIVSRLSPYCSRIQIAGSIRRGKPEVKDIEIVCIPLEVNGCHHPEFTRIIDSMEKVKGNASTGRYMQRITPEGIKLDLFTARKNNWGFILSQRTGSADYSHYVLACGWVKKGFKSINAILTKNGIEYPTYEEKDLFELIDIPFVPAEERCYNHS